MSYGYPTSGGGGSGYGSNAYNTSYAPPTTGYDTTGYYASTAAGGSGPAASGAVAGPLHYSPTPPPQDPADAQADIDKALQEGTHTNATNYYSQSGRWLGTEIEAIDEPRDGRPQLPGRESHWTRDNRRMDVSPHFPGMHTRNYTQHNFNGPQGEIRAWAHYQGTDDNHLSTYDYQAHGADQPPPEVDSLTQGRDRWASESLDRGRPPNGTRGGQANSANQQRQREELRARAREAAEVRAREEGAARAAAEARRASEVRDARVRYYPGQGGSSGRDQHQDRRRRRH